LTRLNSISYFF